MPGLRIVTTLMALGSTVWHALVLDMAQVLLKYGTDPVTRKLAEDTIKARKSEITMMKDWLAAPRATMWANGTIKNVISGSPFQ